jgi:hypothetical protein
MEMRSALISAPHGLLVGRQIPAPARTLCRVAARIARLRNISAAYPDAARRRATVIRLIFFRAHRRAMAVDQFLLRCLVFGSRGGLSVENARRRDRKYQIDDRQAWLRAPARQAAACLASRVQARGARQDHRWPIRGRASHPFGNTRRGSRAHPPLPSRSVGTAGHGPVTSGRAGMSARTRKQARASRGGAADGRAAVNQARRDISSLSQGSLAWMGLGRFRATRGERRPSSRACDMVRSSASYRLSIWFVANPPRSSGEGKRYGAQSCLKSALWNSRRSGHDRAQNSRSY